jgi:hypothetical protein
MKAQKEENFYDIQKELEQKNNQIKTLQSKLDSQDIIISDYYSLKDKYSLAKNEILNLKKIIEDLKSNKSSLEFEIKRGNVEKNNLRNNINELKNQLKDIKLKTNNIYNIHNKMENEINDYKKRELMLGTVQIENQTLNTKISTLNDIQNQKDKTIYELKDINNKLNIEKNNIKKENEENKKEEIIDIDNQNEKEKEKGKVNNLIQIQIQPPKISEIKVEKDINIINEPKKEIKTDIKDETEKIKMPEIIINKINDKENVKKETKLAKKIKRIKENYLDKENIEKKRKSASIIVKREKGLGIQEDDDDISDKINKIRKMSDFYNDYDKERISKSKRLQYKLKKIKDNED